MTKAADLNRTRGPSWLDSQRDSKQLLGRHLMQRRALYARALKSNDHRTALQVLRDEAELQGLYPPTKVAPTTPDGRHPYPGPDSPPLSRRERLVQLIAAEANNDRKQLRLLEFASPRCALRIPDTMLPLQMLHVMTLIHVSEQLEQTATVTNGLLSATLDAAHVDSWELTAVFGAYHFRVGRVGWEKFTESIGVDGDYLVRSNYRGRMLQIYGDDICERAPYEDQIRAELAKSGRSAKTLITADSAAKSWRKVLAQILDD